MRKGFWKRVKRKGLELQALNKTVVSCMVMSPDPHYITLHIHIFVGQYYEM